MVVVFSASLFNKIHFKILCDGNIALQQRGVRRDAMLWYPRSASHTRGSSEQPNPLNTQYDGSCGLQTTPSGIRVNQDKVEEWVINNEIYNNRFQQEKKRSSYTRWATNRNHVTEQMFRIFKIRFLCYSFFQL